MLVILPTDPMLDSCVAPCAADDRIDSLVSYGLATPQIETV